jgi:hypothetical protein
MMKFLVLVLGVIAFSLANPTAVSRNYDEEVCDPHTMTLEQYPAILTKLDVVLTNPLKLRATFRLPNSTKKISAEGMYLDFTASFSQENALGACRSLGCSKAAGRVSAGWTPTQTCRFTCPDGASAFQTCRNMQQDFKCPIDAMSLKECITRPFFLGIPENIKSIAFVCSECGED